jgi:hypothetical protein
MKSKPSVENRISKHAHLNMQQTNYAMKAEIIDVIVLNRVLVANYILPNKLQFHRKGDFKKDAGVVVFEDSNPTIHITCLTP